MQLRRRSWALGALLMILASSLLASSAGADQNYSQQVFFDNSLSPGSYFYSSGRASYPSVLELIGERLPIETDSFISAPNALKLRWKSEPAGGWAAEIRLYAWRNRTIEFPGHFLWIWMCAPDGIPARDLPRIALRDADGGFSHPLEASPFTADLPPHKWVRVRIPLDAFRSASVHPFEPHRLNTIVLIQSAADAVSHTLYLDDIRIEDAPGSQHALPAPQGVEAKGYERHVDITWLPVEDPNLAQYVIYRSQNGSPFKPIGVQRPGVNRFCDYIGDPHATASYRVTARTSTLLESAPSAPATASTHPMSDDELLTMVQEASFRYYWEAAEPHSGMTRESQPGADDVIALGASGFGVMAIVVGAERGFITRSQALDRLLQITAFLEKADRFHGAWPHFLSGSTGHVLPVFGMYDDGADLVETSFLMEGLLTARQYFKSDGASGKELYDRITRLWQGVEWNWFASMPTHDALWWHWSPDYSFYIANRLTGWNEVMITYLEAIASPTHSIPASDYYTGWTGEPVGTPYSNNATYFGIAPKVGSGTGGPLFFTDYSYMGFDPHALTDRFTNYFDHNRNQALINQAYCIHDPNHWKGYGADTWGITAVDGPDGYVPYEPTEQLDDGTIAPTGAISAMAYTPEQSMLALRHFYRDLGAQVWGIYGFRDAFNLQQNWYSGITMGLNQAPMAVMIENYRSGSIWKNYMANPEIQPMVQNVESLSESH
ncbi:MAG TPA: glucoamylase family protein [Acidobacteriaceae bacterium]|nr:glucoamylase family protein [Acidobacteriaceae bacterium]